MCFSTTTNTMGMGDVVPPSGAALTGAEQANNSNLGSGDRYTSASKTSKSKKKKENISIKKAAPNYGAELPYLVYLKKKR